MKKKTLLLIVLAALMIGVLSGCGSKRKLVGKWEGQYDTYLFEKDGTVKYDFLSTTLTMFGLDKNDMKSDDGEKTTYKVKGNHLELTTTLHNTKTKEDYTFEIEDDELTLYENDKNYGKTYKRISKKSSLKGGKKKDLKEKYFTQETNEWRHLDFDSTGANTIYLSLSNGVLGSRHEYMGEYSVKNGKLVLQYNEITYDQYREANKEKMGVAELKEFLGVDEKWENEETFAFEIDKEGNLLLSQADEDGYFGEAIKYRDDSKYKIVNTSK